MRHQGDPLGKRPLRWALISGVLATSTAQALPVIPGASGYGMDTPAGRGGEVYKVTNLNESGSGSLKECVDASGPRVCVFEVSGTIHLSSNMVIRNPNLTIAGQTAPSPGITITGGALQVGADDVLVQHIRLRVGDDSDGVSPEMRDSLKVGLGSGSADGVVIDHVSISWSVDELTEVWSNTGEVTFRNNIFSEALEDSIHPKGPHGFGVLLGDKPDLNATMVGNLFAHTKARNPLSRAPELIFVNNVLYNWKNMGVDLQGDDGLVTRNSIVGNYFKEGPDGGSNPITMRGRGGSLDMTPGSKVYVEDNAFAGHNISDPWSIVNMESSLNGSYQASSPPVWNDGLKAKSAEEAYEWVLKNAGARPADRDSVDKRVIQSVREGSGRIIDSPSEVGGGAELPENRRKLSIPSNPSDDDDGDGYTNLEEWLHAMADEVEGAAAPPAAPTNLTVE